jgi:4-amino-4-deoxy-L-arabinose transferase-like glycosyltransferase
VNRRSDWVVAAVLAVLVIAGGVLRFDAAASPTRYQSSDEKAYARIAHVIADHLRYVPEGMDDAVRWGPGAPFAFAVAERLAGNDDTNEHDVRAAYPWQAAFGTLTILAVFALGALLGNRYAGLAAAAAVALYPPLIAASADLLTEPLGALMLTLALIVLVLALRRPGSWALAAGTGLLLGLTVLVRVDLLVLPAIGCAVLALGAWRALGRRPALVSAGAAAAGALIALGPWIAYASADRGRFVPVTSGGASNLFIGTYTPGDGRLYGVKAGYADRVRKRHPEYADRAYASIPLRLVFDEIEAEYPGRGREGAIRAAAFDNIRNYVLGDPLGFAALSVKKAWRLWGWPTRGSGRPREPWMRTVHLPLLLLASAGLIAGLVASRGRDLALWAPTLVLAWVTATNALLVAEARHNLPVMPILFAAGAAGAVLAYRRWKA